MDILKTIIIKRENSKRKQTLLRQIKKIIRRKIKEDYVWAFQEKAKDINS